MDDEIEFVQALPMAGTLSDKVSDICQSVIACTGTVTCKLSKTDYFKLQIGKYHSHNAPWSVNHIHN